MSISNMHSVEHEPVEVHLREPHPYGREDEHILFDATTDDGEEVVVRVGRELAMRAVIILDDGEGTLPLTVRRGDLL